MRTFSTLLAIQWYGLAFLHIPATLHNRPAHLLRACGETLLYTALHLSEPACTWHQSRRAGLNRPHALPYCDRIQGGANRGIHVHTTPSHRRPDPPPADQRARSAAAGRVPGRASRGQRGRRVARRMPRLGARPRGVRVCCRVWALPARLARRSLALGLAAAPAVPRGLPRAAAAATGRTLLRHRGAQPARHAHLRRARRARRAARAAAMAGCGGRGGRSSRAAHRGVDLEPEQRAAQQRDRAHAGQHAAAARAHGLGAGAALRRVQQRQGWQQDVAAEEEACTRAQVLFIWPGNA